MTERKKLEKELSITLTKIIENSRATLKEQILTELKDETDLVKITTEAFIDKDCDTKLLKIPSVIKGMLDEADANAEKNSNGVLTKSGLMA